MPQITVLTTVFNGIDTLPETVDSILNQTLHDFEYIIIDDGSTDGTYAWLEQLNDSRVKVVRISRSGRGVALNAGLEKATTDLIAILDADDVAAPSRLEVQSKIMRQHNDYAVLACRCTHIHSGLMNSPNTKVTPRKVEPREFIKHNLICHSGAVIRRKALQDVSDYDSSRTELFDYDLWLRLAERGHSIGVINIPLVFKRLHRGQKFERNRRINYLSSAYRCKQRALMLFPHNYFDNLYPIITFLYGLLPINVRRLMMGRGQK